MKRRAAVLAMATPVAVGALLGALLVGGPATAESPRMSAPTAEDGQSELPKPPEYWSVNGELHLKVVAKKVSGTIGDETWARLAAHFDETQILEAIALAGYYHTISFLCRALDLPLEAYAARFPDRHREGTQTKQAK